MFREEKLREALNKPPHIKPVAIIPIGHTKSKEKPRPRKPLEESVPQNSPLTIMRVRIPKNNKPFDPRTVRGI